jgi:hypothetical protein
MYKIYYIKKLFLITNEKFYEGINNIYYYNRKEILWGHKF